MRTASNSAFIGGTPLATHTLSGGASRSVFLETFFDLVQQVRTHFIKASMDANASYHQASSWQPPEGQLLRDRYEWIRNSVAAIGDDIPCLGGLINSLTLRMGCVLDRGKLLQQIWPEVVGICCELLSRTPTQSRAGEDGCRVLVEMDSMAILFPSQIGLSHQNTDETSDALAFLAAIQALMQRHRAQSSVLDLDMLIALQAAYHYIAKGLMPYRSVSGWGTSGFRDHQTYMSVTDPGEGHLHGTLSNRANLDGVIVHIEHLERAGHPDRSHVEPYRIPHPYNASKVAFTLGSDAPASGFIGRPIFEGGGPSTGMLKAVHTVATSCSEMFSHGLCECKVAVEGMKATEAVSFLRSVSAATRRDRFTQILSAAFNLNSPMVDDRGKRHREVSRRFDVGQLGIEIADAAGIKKVTWDGSGDEYPSQCVLEQIGHREAITLVHEAHERGLLTYFSAGFRLHHIASAVFTGVDGVGVGGGQILRFMDRANGNHGPFRHESIADILAARDAAEKSIHGRGASCLARLDRMYFERTISRDENELREELFALLADASTNAPRIGLILDKLANADIASIDAELPLVAWVRRLEISAGNCLAAEGISRSLWNSVVARLSGAAAARDYEFLEYCLLGLREGYGFLDLLWSDESRGRNCDRARLVN